MAGTPITQFKKLPSSSSRLTPLRPCMEDYGAGDDPEAEWPNNILSRKTVVYESGVIAREGDAVQHSVDPDELELCRELAKEAHRAAEEIEFGLDTEAGFSFYPFFIAANSDDRVGERIDEQFIRAKFVGTIFPPATISMEPLSEEAAWFLKMLKICEEEEDIERWRAMVRWFRERPEFIDSAFVQIGTYEDARLDKKSFPPGTSMVGSAFPVLAVGLTKRGSLAGVCGHIVQT